MNTSFLLEPALNIPLEEALELFEYTDVRLVCKKPDDLSEFPDLPTRLRGALGRQLYNISQAMDLSNDPFSRLSPFGFLFGEHGFQKSHLALPKPLAVRSWVDNGEFHVLIRLLGHAQYYAPLVLECMAEALGSGISITENAKYRVPVSVQDSWIEEYKDINPVFGNLAVLSFETPFCVRSGHNVTLSKRALLNSMYQRSNGLLRWCDIELSSDTKLPREKENHLMMDSNELRHIKWKRYSIRQKGTTIYMQGFLGKLKISGDLGHLCALLKVCELFGIGSHAALGLGAFKLTIYP
jgi:hypothetical protein